MSRKLDEENNIALFIDFDNIAIGIRDTKFGRVKIKFVIDRLLEKGNVIIKKAYADWSRFQEYKDELHENAIELIEIPKNYMTGKNSGDIRLVVDAMDLCHTKDHLDCFAIVSGDSDFSPLVSKLRENNKKVIGIGIKHSSSNLLIDNCDEFIFYDDLVKEIASPAVPDNLPKGKAKNFRLLVTTMQALFRENKEVLYSSMVKQTMKRLNPTFDEGALGYSSFSNFLEDARDQGIIDLERNTRGSGTYVITGFGKSGKPLQEGNGKRHDAPPPVDPPAPARGGRRGA